MDALTSKIAEFAAELSYDDLPDDTRGATLRRVVDTVGCAIGGRDAEPSKIARQVAPPSTGGWIIGQGDARTTLEGAAFANTVMIRYLDFNDWYPGGHPSDCLGALLPVAASAGASGSDLLTATTIAYEIAIRFTVAADTRRRGWDQGLSMGLGVTAASGRLLGLSAAQIANAVAITAASSVALRVARTGQLSLWKGAATAYACRNGVFAAQVAAAGMTGPSEPFAGRMGIFDQVSGGPIDLPLGGETGTDFILPSTSLKFWPVCYHLQAAVWGAKALREAAGSSEFTEVDVFANENAWKDTGNEAAKWDPRSRETADHSLPYVLARTLLDGDIGPAAFAPEAVLDTELRPVMQRITVSRDDKLEAAFPENTIMRVRGRDQSGQSHEVEIVNPLGHWRNPLGDDDITTKTVSLMEPTLGTDGARAAADCAWGLDTLDTVTELLASLQVPDDE